VFYIKCGLNIITFPSGTGGLSRVSRWKLDGGEDDEEMCEEHAAGDIHEASAFAAGERRTDSLSTPPR